MRDSVRLDGHTDVDGLQTPSCMCVGTLVTCTYEFRQNKKSYIDKLKFLISGNWDIKYTVQFHMFCVVKS